MRGGVDWGSAAVSLLLAAGLTMTFVAPLHRMAPLSRAPGVVAGVRDAQPLRVIVSVKADGQQYDLQVSPSSGRLVEVLARSANELRGSFAYDARGQGQYLQTFWQHRNGSGGSWSVTHNGLPVGDLATIMVAQADSITLTWNSSL